MIHDVRQAVAAAISFVADMLRSEKIMDIRLEEVDVSEDGQFWHITLSFLREPKAPSDAGSDALRAALGRIEREYKVLAIRSHDGQVTSMKMRQPA